MVAGCAGGVTRVLIRHDVLRRIESGEVTLAFRRWKRATVKPGTRMRTAVGVIEVVTVDEVAAASEAEARAAGFDSLEALLAVDAGREGRLFRLGLRYAGPDPRVELRETDVDESSYQEVMARLGRLDAVSNHGPWTEATLSIIAAKPGIRAVELAAELAREKKPFKIDVRKLKELGLTESLRVGYRLSPRGRSVIARWIR
jgi:hypothetical protein